MKIYKALFRKLPLSVQRELREMYGNDAEFVGVTVLFKIVWGRSKSPPTLTSVASTLRKSVPGNVSFHAIVSILLIGFLMKYYYS
jgi:hypothetical protein